MGWAAGIPARRLSLTASSFRRTGNALQCLRAEGQHAPRPQPGYQPQGQQLSGEERGPPCMGRSLQGACTSACKGMQNQTRVHQRVKACKHASLCIYIYAACTTGLTNLTSHGEKDAEGEDSLAKQQLKTGSFKPIPDA